MNIRPACGQTVYHDPIPVLGRCGQSFSLIGTESSSIKIKHNVTKMLNYATGSPSPPTWIPVFKIAQGGGLESSCSPYASDPPQNFICGDGVNGFIWCHMGFNSASIQACTGTGSYTFPVGNYWNCYSQSQDTASSNPCNTDNRAFGYKNLYSNKTWSGRKSYTSRDWQAPDGFDCCGDGCWYHEADLGSSDPIKYRTISATFTENFNETSPVCSYYTPEGAGEFCCIDGYTPCDCTSEGCPLPGSPIWCRTCEAGSTVDRGCDASATTTVDIYGDVVVASCASSSYGYYDDIAIANESERALGLIENANSNISILANSFTIEYSKFYFIMGIPQVLTSDGPGSWHAEWHITAEICHAGCGGVTSTSDITLYSITVTPNSFSETIENVNTNGESSWCVGDEQCASVTSGTSTLTFSETTYDNINGAEFEPSYSFGGTYTSELHAILANPYTISDVKKDMVDMMALWDLGDDLQLPWRRDAITTLGPKICHDEGLAIPSVPQCQTTSFYTGVIKGAPAPIGIDYVWDFDHPNYCICAFVTDTETCYAPYVLDWGASSTDCGTPRATNWLDYMEGNSMPQGAFLGSSFLWTHPSTCNLAGPSQPHDEVLWACKYAEAVFPKQSFNYIRPCGADRLAISESSTRCISSTSDNTIFIEPSGPPTDIQSTKVFVCGTSTLDGLWEASSDWNYTITLTEPRLASASYFPTTPISDCGSGMIYKLQWKSVPGICGTLDILAVSNENPVTCSISSGGYLIDGDAVQIVGVKGLTSINGFHNIHVIGLDTITIDGIDGTTLSPYAGGGTIQNQFSPDQAWNDTNGKGDFTYKTWLYNYRDLGEYNRVLGEYNWNMGLSDCITFTPPCSQLPTLIPEPRPYQNACGLDPNVISMSCVTSCMPFNPCGANAAYFSPNKESFNSSSHNCGWAPNTFVPLDQVYPTYWAGIITQQMDDLYYQAPPCTCIPNTDPDTEITTYACDSNCSWAEDNGTCQTDIPGDSELGIPCHKYFAARDVFEARCEVPTGAPPLIGGKHLGCLTVAQLNTPNCPEGNVCNSPANSWGIFPLAESCAPFVAYQYHNYGTPWIPWLSKEGCVCSDSRFAETYIANGVGVSPTCDMVFPPP